MTKQEAKFRDEFKAFLKDFYKEEEEELNDQLKGQGLGLCYLTRVYAKLNPDSLLEDPRELEENIVDGPYDQDVDFLISRDNRHYIIQCKYRRKSDSRESDGDVLNFKKVFSKLHPEVGAEYKKNGRLEEALDEIDWQNDTFQLFFISLGRASGNIRHYETEAFEAIDHPDLKDIDDRCEFHFLDEEDLNREYRDSLKSSISLEVNIKGQKDSNGNHWYRYSNEGELVSYITTLDGEQICELLDYRGHRDALFDSNIRNYVGDTKTNKEIIESAQTEPKKFFFYNNGVSAIASEIIEEKETGKLNCKNFSIINGAQSFKSIRKAVKRSDRQSRKTISKLSIMMRITQIPNLIKKEKLKFLEKVIRYNNTQNAVKISDFRSNDGVQKSLARHFEKQTRGGKEYYYKSKRMKPNPKNKKNKIVIELDGFCRTIYSFLYGPAKFDGNLSHLYDDSSPSGGYYLLFGDKDSNLILDTLSEKACEQFAAIFFVCEYVKEIFKKEIKDREEDDSKSLTGDEENNSLLLSKGALHGKFLICYVIGQAFYYISDQENQSIKDYLVSQKFNDPDWRKDVKKQKLIKDLVSLCCDVLIQDYNSRREKKDFNNRNWRREQDTLERLRTRLRKENFGRLRGIFETYSSDSKQSA